LNSFLCQLRKHDIVTETDNLPPASILLQTIGWGGRKTKRVEEVEEIEKSSFGQKNVPERLYPIVSWQRNVR
jgi:hypothetical protein